MRHRHRWIVGTLGVLAAAIVMWCGRDLGAAGRTTTQIRLQVSALGELGVGLSTITDDLDQNFTQLFASGTGSQQASNLYHAERTLTASASENLDLSGTLTNGFGVTLNFTEIKALLIKASSTNTNDVFVGGGSTSIDTIFSATSGRLRVKPGGVLLLIAPGITTNGYGVTASGGDLLTVANSAGGSSVTYSIIVLGDD